MWSSTSTTSQQTLKTTSSIMPCLWQGVQYFITTQSAWFWIESVILKVPFGCRHSDFVTAIDFHPTNDKIFVSGSLDGKVKIASLFLTLIPQVFSWDNLSGTGDRLSLDVVNGYISLRLKHSPKGMSLKDHDFQNVCQSASMAYMVYLKLW